MLRLSRIATLLTLVVAGAVYLPATYWKAFGKRPESRLIRYSAVLDRFVYRGSDAQDNTIYRDEDGNEYDYVEFQMNLPFLYHANLVKWELFPDEIAGREIDPATIRDNLQYVRLHPEDITAPQIPLYPLFESKPVFSRLALPPDMFRITRRMEFVNASSNRIDEAKSERLTAALAAEGFRFPARRIAGNTSPRKPFDEGYFVVDAADRLFHVKLVEGEPMVRDTGIAPESGIKFVDIKENGRREFYGLLITGDDRIGLISYDDYRFVELPLPGYDPDTMPFYMWVDPLNRTFIYIGEDTIHCVATDPEYRVVRTWDSPIDKSRNAAARAAADWLFPFRIRTTRSELAYYVLDPDVNRMYGLGGMILGLIVLGVVRFWRGHRFRDWWGDLVWAVLFGIFGALAVLIVGPAPVRKLD